METFLNPPGHPSRCLSHHWYDDMILVILVDSLNILSRRVRTDPGFWLVGGNKNIEENSRTMFLRVPLTVKKVIQSFDLWDVRHRTPIGCSR